MSEDILKDLRDAGFEPQVIEDTSFEPIKGKYVARIDDAGRVQGVSKTNNEPYDFRTISFQVVETVDGQKGDNRFLKRTYRADADGMKKLLTDLHTAGIECKCGSEAELDEMLPGLKDKTVNLSAYVSKEWTTPDGKTIPAGKQVVRVVNSFKGKSKPSEAKSNVPF